MLHLFFATVLLGTALAPGRDERLEVRIENVERREGQVSFRVVMRNPGPTPLLLEETTKGTREPYAVNIERATGSQGWEFVGPHRDVPPVDAFALSARESVEVRIVLLDPYPMLYETPLREIPLVGKFRATVRYFRSKGEYDKSIKKQSQQGEEAVSPAVTILPRSR